MHQLNYPNQCLLKIVQGVTNVDKNFGVDCRDFTYPSRINFLERIIINQSISNLNHLIQMLIHSSVCLMGPQVCNARHSARCLLANYLMYKKQSIISRVTVDTLTCMLSSTDYSQFCEPDEDCLIVSYLQYGTALTISPFIFGCTSIIH